MAEVTTITTHTTSSKLTKDQKELCEMLTAKYETQWLGFTKGAMPMVLTAIQKDLQGKHEMPTELISTVMSVIATSFVQGWEQARKQVLN